MRSYGKSDGPGAGVWLLVILGALVVVGALGLGIYGGMVQPQTHQIEQVLPNDRFAQ